MGYDGPRLYKRGRKWWAWVNGERVSTGCEDRRAAELAAKRLQREAADPTHRAAAQTCLKDALEAWRDDRAAVGRSEATLSYYEAKAGHLVRVLGDGLPLASISREAVRGYIVRRRGEGAGQETIFKELGALRSCLRWARGEGLYAGDPRAVLPVGFASGYEPRRLYLKTPDDAWRLVLALAEPYPNRRAQPAEALGRAAHAAFIIGTACRWGESERAERADVDLATGLARVRGTKTAKADRTVPIVGPARPFVEYALENAPGGKRGPLFEPWGRSRHALNAACARAGLEAMSANDLRRTLPSWLAQAGVPLDLVADVLGHADTRMARRVYAVRTPESTGAAIGRLLAAATVSNLYVPGAPERPESAPVSPPEGQKTG